VNYPIWQLESGGGLLIALVAVTHVFISHFAVGGGLFLVVTEHFARRAGDTALLDWLRRHAKFFAIFTLVAGALSGVGIWFTISLVQATATSALIHAFFFGWAIEWVFFAVEIAAALLYSSTWDRVDARTHLALGWIYAGAAVMSLVVISGILSFMLTPGEWLVSRSFWDGFFNPTFLPSVVVRGLGAIAFAGLYVLATAWREPLEHRARLTRLAALWALPATVASPAAAWLFFRAGNPGQSGWMQGDLAAATLGSRVATGAAVAYAVLLVALAFLSRRWPRLVSLPAGLALLALGYATIGGAELAREAIRKPWIIGSGASGYMYANGLTPDEVLKTRVSGILPGARWLAPRNSDAPLDPRAEGKEVFQLACQSCHTLSGRHDIRRFVDDKPLASIAAAIPRLEKLRGGMPPFPGNEREARSLALYLASLDGVEEPAPAAPAAIDAMARGRLVLEEKCLMCHKDARIGPLVRGWTEERAFEALGRLPALDPAMSDFDGTLEERRALAGYLAEAGKALLTQ